MNEYSGSRGIQRKVKCATNPNPNPCSTIHDENCKQYFQLLDQLEIIRSYARKAFFPPVSLMVFKKKIVTEKKKNTLLVVH